MNSRTSIITDRVSGNMTAQSMPFLRSSPKKLAIIPAKVGPAEQPISPPSQSIAYIAVPPPWSAEDILPIVPGQRIPADSPHTATPTRPRMGEEVSEIRK